MVVDLLRNASQVPGMSKGYQYGKGVFETLKTEIFVTNSLMGKAPVIDLVISPEK